MSEISKKIENETQSKLSSIEILKFKDKEVLDNLENMSEENFDIIYNSNLLARYFPITDLNEKYVVKINIATNPENNPYEVLDPNEINPLDQFELSESVAQILRKLNIKAAPLKDDAEIQRDAFEAGKAKLKEIQKKIKEKISESENAKNRTD